MEIDAIIRSITLLEAVLCAFLAFIYSRNYVNRKIIPSLFLSLAFLLGALSFLFYSFYDGTNNRLLLLSFEFSVLSFGFCSLFGLHLVKGENFRKHAMAPISVVLLSTAIIVFFLLSTYQKRVLGITLVPLLFGLVFYPALILGYYGWRLPRSARRKVILMACSFLLMGLVMAWDLSNFYGQRTPFKLLTSRIGYIISTILVYVSISLSYKEISYDFSNLARVERRILEYFDSMSKLRKTVTDRDRIRSLKSGYVYMIKEPDSKKTLKIFANQINSGFFGLCISRTHPKHIRVDYDELKNVPVMWLTDVPNVNEHTTIRPNPEQIFSVIRDFINKSKGESVILIDGLEYLINHNDFNTILCFIEEFRDLISLNNSLGIISIHPKTLREIELKLLERETSVIESD